MPTDIPYGNYNIEGLGPNSPIEKNGEGVQSEVKYSFHLLPPLAMARVAAILFSGENKYGRNQWTKLTDIDNHVGRAIGHCMAYLAGDTQEGTPDEHLCHALCRLLFAVDLLERNKQDNDNL